MDDGLRFGDIDGDGDGVRELTALLERRCETGGTVKDGRIEIRGDQRRVEKVQDLGPAGWYTHRLSLGRVRSGSTARAS
jgi:hypothetical protein